MTGPELQTACNETRRAAGFLNKHVPIVYLTKNNIINQRAEIEIDR